MADPSKVASMNPDNMVAGGMQDDFDGTITKVRLVPWNYGGKIDNHVLATAVTIKPADGDEFTQHYSTGNLEDFVPSMDGENSVNLEATDEEIEADPTILEGIYAMRVGSKEALSNSSNWAHFITAALDAGFDKTKLSADVRMFEGITAHFNRIPQKKRSGLVKPAEVAGQQAKRNDILVITEIKAGAPAGKPATGSKTPATGTSASSKSSPAAKTATPAASAAPVGGDLDSKLVEVLRKALAGAEDGLTKDKLPSLALKGLPAADKGKGVKRIVDPEFLGSQEAFWAFDAESGLVISVE